jgi:hypothetical protein
MMKVKVWARRVWTLELSLVRPPVRGSMPSLLPGYLFYEEKADIHRSRRT